MASMTMKSLIDNRPLKDWVVMINGTRYEASNFEEAREIAKDHKFYAFWDCTDRKHPIFCGASA